MKRKEKRKKEAPHGVAVQRIVRLRGGTELTPEQCKDALDAAMLIVQKVGTTGIEQQYQEAERWMKRYYAGWD